MPKLFNNKIFYLRFSIFLIISTFVIAYAITHRSLLQVDMPLKNSDALVLLAGSSEEKILAASMLFKDGYASKIIITNDGVFSSWSQKYERNLYEVEWAEEKLIDLGIPRESIVKLPFYKSGTIYDALSTKEYIVKSGIRKIILITSDYHSRRALWAFEQVFRNYPIALSVYPVNSANVGLTEVVKEYIKLAYYFVRFGPIAPDNMGNIATAQADNNIPKNNPVALETGGLPNSKSILKTQYGALQIFPDDNPWNQDISKLPVHPNSANYIRSIGVDKGLHPDFGTIWEGAPNGIDYVVVPGTQEKEPMRFEYVNESDKGPYPIPPDVPIQGGTNAKGDRHVIVIDYHNKKLYELWNAHKENRGWFAGSGAIFDLTSNRLRPAGWTSADAAGLPIFPGLVRYDEVVVQKEIRHALRFTVEKTQRAYIAPARHFASSSTDRNLPPMGMRVRLKANFDIGGFSPSLQVIFKALKKYGMILADNGGDWFITGAPNPLWSDEELHLLNRVKGSDLEVVYTGETVTK